jgi:septum formation protein
VNEDPLQGENPRDYVVRLAESKARSAAAAPTPGAVYLGADTTVVDLISEGQEEILGKPVDPSDAFQMLARLRGREHLVITAAAAYDPHNDQLEKDLCVTTVLMRSYSVDEILSYIETGDPMDKAGAYAIQHETFDPVKGISGCFTNVVGLPLCRVEALLQKVGLPAPSDITRECRGGQNPACLVYKKLMQDKD